MSGPSGSGSWGASIPLLAAILVLGRRIPALVLGVAYGAGFYVVVNSLALPWLFGDPTPWQLGLGVVLPSLLLHLEYGAVVAWTASRRPSAHR